MTARTRPEPQAGRPRFPAAPDPADPDLHRLQDHVVPANAHLSTEPIRGGAVTTTEADTDHPRVSAGHVPIVSTGASRMQPTNCLHRGVPRGGIRLFRPAEPIISGDPSGHLALHDLSRIRAAAHHARRAYPGAVGELLARELTAHAEFGYRFTGDGLLTRLAAEVLRTPVPS